MTLSLLKVIQYYAQKKKTMESFSFYKNCVISLLGDQYMTIVIFIDPISEASLFTSRLQNYDVHHVRLLTGKSYQGSLLIHFDSDSHLVTHKLH